MSEIAIGTVEKSGDGTPYQVQRLRKNAVGLTGVIFMTIATAAPITAMLGNVPISVGSGNGYYAPASYLVATIVLALFAIGYAEMAKHITATGAFYGFISRGLGRAIGMASGYTITLTYMVFEAAVVGVFGFFCNDLLLSLFGLDLGWFFYSALMVAANGLLSHYDISLTAKILGICLVLEIAILTAVSVAVLVNGGGESGISFSSINPLNAFESAKGVAGASAGIGLFFAFCSWVGFESSAMYGEESKDPKKIIPLATILTVVGIGLFYVFVSWMAISGTGPEKSVALAQNSATAAEIFYTPTRQYFGEWAVGLFKILVVTGSFACGMAFHNCAARYIYAIGRENLFDSLGKTIGRTHSVHGSPHVASALQSLVCAVIVTAFYLAHKDPYADLYALLGIMGTMGVLIVQVICAFAIINFFHGPNRESDKGHWFKTLVAPFLGGMGMLYVVHLLFANMSFAAGQASNSVLFKMIPWLIFAVFALGLVIAIYLKISNKQKYLVIGSITLD